MSRVRPVRDTSQRDRLLINHRPLVTPIAHHYAQLSPEPVEDLIQVGLLGLLRAAEGYEPASQVPFDSYARPHIRGAILHHLRDRAWLVRLPRRQAERQWGQRHHGGERSQPETTAAEQALLRWRAMSRPLSLETLQSEQSPNSAERLGVSAAVAAMPGGDPDATYVPVRLNLAWHQCSAEQLLALVGPRQRRVLRHVVLDGWSYRRTATALKVSAPTVQRVLHRALAELQSRLSSDRVPFAAPGC
jgi:RNA polymerase sigma-B factor